MALDPQSIQRFLSIMGGPETWPSDVDYSLANRSPVRGEIEDLEEEEEDPDALLKEILYGNFINSVDPVQVTQIQDILSQIGGEPTDDLLQQNIGTVGTDLADDFSRPAPDLNDPNSPILQAIMSGSFVPDGAPLDPLLDQPSGDISAFTGLEGGAADLLGRNIGNVGNTLAEYVPAIDEETAASVSPAPLGIPNDGYVPKYQGDYYDPNELSAYLESMRGNNLLEPDRISRTPSFHNISGAEGFDVRSPEKQLQDDIREEQKLMSLSDLTATQIKERNKATGVAATSLTDSTTIQRAITREKHLLEVKMDADRRAMEEQFNVPQLRDQLTQWMGTKDYRQNPYYTQLHGQMDAAVLKTNIELDKRTSQYNEKVNYINQLSDQLVVVKGVEIKTDKRNAKVDSAFINTATNLGIDREMQIDIADWKGITLDELQKRPPLLASLSPTQHKYFSERKAGIPHDMGNLIQYSPDTVAIEQHFASRDKSIETQSIYKSTNDIHLKAEEAAQRAELSPTDITLTKDNPKAAAARLEQLQTVERTKVWRDAQGIFKRTNADWQMLDLTSDPTAKPEEIQMAQFLLGYMKKRLGERSLWDVKGQEYLAYRKEIIMALKEAEAGGPAQPGASAAMANPFTSGPSPDSPLYGASSEQVVPNLDTSIDVDKIMHKMFSHMKKQFNSKYGNTAGIVMSLDDFPMWGF